jgi:colicin import membrane protein
MADAHTADDPLRPRPPDRLGRGGALALAVHGGLVAALAVSVNWRSEPVEATVAELWASVPQVAAPPAPAPAPAPEPAPTPAPAPAPAPAPPPPAARDADIALERQRREAERERQAAAEREARERAERERAAADRAERERAERERREQAERQRREEAARQRAAEQRRQAEEKRLAEQREENLRRMMGQAGGSGTPSSTGSAARDAGPSASYLGRLVAAIKPNIVFTDTLPGNPAAEVEVRAGPTGTVISRRLVRSSGHPEWDEAVLRAIDRTATLPRDTDGRVPSPLVITFRPNE